MDGANTKFTVGAGTRDPVYMEWERELGFQTDMVLINGGNGVPVDKVIMAEVPNQRKTDPYIDQKIQSDWKREVDKNPNTFDAPRARLEGSIYDNDNGNWTVFWSQEKYSTHNAVRLLKAGPSYQANLLTMNVVFYTKDHQLPIALKNPVTTDQGRINSLSPIGFYDLVKQPIYDKTGAKSSDRLAFEGIENGVRRILDREWEVPEGAVDLSKMEVLAHVYNSFKNFDYTMTLFMPIDCGSSELKSKQLPGSKFTDKPKYDDIEYVPMSESNLTSKLIDFALSPNTNAGHMRGDIAATIGRLYGGRQKYLNVLEKAYTEVLKRSI